MSYGMTYEQFWNGDPYMVQEFRDAYILKRRIQNENLWLAGAYTYQAVTIAINNAISKSPMHYTKEPLNIFPKTKAEQEREVTAARNDLIRQLSMFQTAFNAKHKKQNKGVGESATDNS